MVTVVKNSSDSSDDVSASANITDNSIVRGDGGGKDIQGSVVTISDTGQVAGVISISMLNKVLAGARIVLADDGIKNLYVDGFTGYGEIIIGDNEEYAHFRWTSAGVVSLTTSTDNITNIEGNAGTFNIYDNGTGVSFENKLGASKTVSYHIYYSQE